jgi:ribosome-associated translation inhibitor RaiA
MKLPFELMQKDVALTPAKVEEIRERAEKLGRFHSRIMRCRVTVEGSGTHHRQGHYQVQIDLTVPGTELLVRKEATANLELALKDAFGAAGRRLEDQISRRRGLVKRHHEAGA